MHDDLGPALAGVRLRLDTAAAQLVHQPSAQGLVVAAAAEIDRIVADVPRIVHGTPPPDLDVGLPDALRRLVARVGSRRPVVTLELPEQRPEVTSAVAEAAYRISAEALTNAVRHGQTSHVTIRLMVAGNDIVLEVIDDGHGIASGVRPRRGVGLGSMRHRAREIGGWCAVFSRGANRSGTVVRAVLPRSPR
nr:ATP-binding region, ATPase-like [Kibdelosporangium sp. MJ126-NF4]CTQ98527.1 ATP-binding region, ATPase-like [Kibdelosporangium sp. MJ126-NF4]